MVECVAVFNYLIHQISHWKLIFLFRIQSHDNSRQAEAELGQSQLKLGLNFNLINLNKTSLIVRVE